MRPVRVGMVGAGFAAAFHLRSHRQVQGVPVEIVALASRTRSRAGGLAGQFGIPTVHDDYRRLLDDPSITVIDLCVPNALHLPKGCSTCIDICPKQSIRMLEEPVAAR